MFNRIAAFTLVLLIGVGASQADRRDQWPNFRGPLATGVAPSANPPTEWSESDNIKWKTKIPGKSSSSPIVWGDRVFVTSAIPTSGQSTMAESPGRRRRRQMRVPTEHRFVIMCLSRTTGDVLWQQTATTGTPGEATHPDNTFASASPSTDGECVIASFGPLGLFCYDCDGNLKWKRTDLGAMKTRGSFGYGSSPTLHGDYVVLPWDHEGDSYLALLRKETGETVWKVDRDEPTNWSTPIVVEQDGVKQIVHAGQSMARGYELTAGKELWSFSGLTQRPIASPVHRDGMAYFASSRGGSFMGAVNLNGRGHLNGTDHEVWTVDKATPDIPSLLLSEDRLYFFTANKAILSCVHAETGKPIGDSKRLGNMRAVYSSPVLAAGRIYVTGRDGNTIVLKDGPNLDVLAENQLGEPVDATPALVGSELFLRGEQHLFCIANEE